MNIRKCKALCLAILGAGLIQPIANVAKAQGSPLAWEAADYFRYNIEHAGFDPATGKVKVIFSVTDPTGRMGTAVDVLGTHLWDIKTDAHFKPPATLRVDVGWTTAEYVNTGSTGLPLATLVPRDWLAQNAPPSAIGAALPLQINALSAAQECTEATCPELSSKTPRVPATLRYWVAAALPAYAEQTGAVAIEGHPSSWPVTVAGVTSLANVPVKSVVDYFAITSSRIARRRQVVSISKCQACHNGQESDHTIIPRLSLHGANRNEEIGVCVVCHNPNQTDIPWRTWGTEESIDFKRMVHGIHGNKKREDPLVIVGFRGTVVDFGEVRFPAELKKCGTCHLDIDGRGTYELPLSSSVLGSSVSTRSQLGSSVPPYGYVDVDPSNDTKITPIASVCSSCHDDSGTRRHMESNGGSFQSTLRADGRWSGRERCVNCHGPGTMKDVRRVHR